MLVIDGWGIFYEIALRWMPLDLIDNKSTLVEVMVWFRQAQTITWANVDSDLYRHMAAWGLYEYKMLCFSESTKMCSPV